MHPAAIGALESALRLAGKLRGLAEYPDPGRYFGPGGVAEAERLCEEANGDLLAFLTPPRDLTPAHVQEKASGRWNRARIHDFRFDSPRPSGRPENDRVEIRLHLPPTAAGVRSVVLFHHPLFQKRWDTWEWFLAGLRSRIPVAMMSAPYHFSRIPRGEFAGEGTVNPNPWRLFESMRQWAWDQRAARTMLRDRCGLETTAVVGFSLGAFQTLLLAAAGDIEVPVVAIACTNRYAYGIHEGPLGQGVRAGLAKLRVSRARFERMVTSIELERYAPRLTGRPVLFVAGRHDRVDPPPSTERLVSALRPSHSVHLEAGHATLVLYRKRVWEEMEWFLEGLGIIEPRGRPRPRRRGARAA